MANPKKGPKRRVKKNVKSGIVHVSSTFNNTVVTITDVSGSVIAWSSAGVKGFKGSRKSTPFAAQLAAEDAARKAILSLIPPGSLPTQPRAGGSYSASSGTFSVVPLTTMPPRPPGATLP